MVRQAFSCPDIDRSLHEGSDTGSRRELEKLGMTQYGAWAASPDRQQVPGWQHGEVAYELTRPPGAHCAQIRRRIQSVVRFRCNGSETV